MGEGARQGLKQVGKDKEKQIMCQDEENQVAQTSSDYLIQKLGDQDKGEEFAIGFLRESFLTAAVNALFYMRQQAGLTQAQVAERLHTKQSAIARLEGDLDGGISLRRYAEFALACGMVPHDITFAPLASAIAYTMAQPETPYTQVNHQEWLTAHPQSLAASLGSVTQAKSNFEAMTQTLQRQSNALFSLEKIPERPPSQNTNTVATAVMPQNDLSPQNYTQPPLMRPFQVLYGGGKISTAAEPQEKSVNLAPSKASQSQIEVSA